LEDHRVGNILNVSELSRGEICALALEECHVLLHFADYSGVVHDVDERVDDFGKVVLGKYSGTSTHCRAWNGVEIVRGDQAKVVSATTKGPVQVWQDSLTRRYDDASRNDNLIIVGS
jgi:hypothetical protein